MTGVHRDDRDQAFHIGLIRRQREFWLSRDPALRARRELLDPGTLFSYVIYDPGTGLASPVHQYQAVRESRGSASGLRRHRIALSPWFHRIPGSWRLIDPSSLRLLVVRRRPIRSESLSWVSRPFASADLPQLSGGGADRPDEPLDRAAFTAWFDALDLPSTDAPEKAVAEHVLRLLEQVARCRFPFDAGHPAVGELARFVPGHATLFVNALRRVPSGQHRVVQILQDALIQGADPSQREAVLEAFPSTPDLLPVIDARGWFGGVVPMIPDLAERAGHDASYLGGLAALETRDPAPLLARFARHPNRGTYELFRAFPGVDPEEVDSLVGTLWSTRPPAMHEHGWPTSGLEVALRHGIPDALGALRRFMEASLIDQPDAAGHSQIGHLLMEIVDLSSLPEQERWAPERVVDWFLAQRPEAFRFDPVSRRWTTGSSSLASACPE